MYERWGWKEEWYVDLVKIEKINGTLIKLTYLFIDVIIEGNGPTYRIIDLDEYAEAINKGNSVTRCESSFNTNSDVS